MCVTAMYYQWVDVQSLHVCYSNVSPAGHHAEPTYVARNCHWSGYKASTSVAVYHLWVSADPTYVKAMHHQHIGIQSLSTHNQF